MSKRKDTDVEPSNKRQKVDAPPPLRRSTRSTKGKRPLSFVEEYADDIRRLMMKGEDEKEVMRVLLADEQSSKAAPKDTDDSNSVAYSDDGTDSESDSDLESDSEVVTNS